MHFVVEEERVVPGKAVLRANVSPKIFAIWDRAQAIAGLMPSTVFVAERRARLERIRDTLNAVASGADEHEAQGTLDLIEKEIRTEQSKIRCRVTRLCFAEIALTLAFAGLVLAIYFGLRKLNFVAWGGGGGYYQNVAQNIIGMVGWMTLGFVIGLTVRRIYELQTMSFARIIERAENETPAWLAVLGNTVLILALSLSIYFGVSFVEIEAGGLKNFKVPGNSILPGIILGLSLPRIVKALMG